MINWSGLNLFEQSHVVAACPMFDNFPFIDSPEVDERPRDCPVRDGDVGEQRHCRSSMGAVQCYVLRDQIAVADEMMLFHDDGSEIVVDDAEDLSQTLPTLRAGRVIHHVLGHQVVEN